MSGTCPISGVSPMQIVCENRSPHDPNQVTHRFYVGKREFRDEDTLVVIAASLMLLDASIGVVSRIVL